MTGATSGTGTAYSTGAPEFTPIVGFLLFILGFYVVFCLSLSFFFWPLSFCLLFDLQRQITILVSSKVVFVLCYDCFSVLSSKKQVKVER